MPSVLWRCWLGSRKGILPVKNWVVGCWCGYLSGEKCRLAYGPADATASVKSRLVLPFWYRITWVVPEKRPLNGCVCVFLSCIAAWQHQSCTNDNICFSVKNGKFSRLQHQQNTRKSVNANKISKFQVYEKLCYSMIYSLLRCLKLCCDAGTSASDKILKKCRPLNILHLQLVLKAKHWTNFKLILLTKVNAKKLSTYSPFLNSTEESL